MAGRRGRRDRSRRRCCRGPPSCAEPSPRTVVAGGTGRRSVGAGSRPLRRSRTVPAARPPAEERTHRSPTRLRGRAARCSRRRRRLKRRSCCQADTPCATPPSRAGNRDPGPGRRGVARIGRKETSSELRHAGARPRRTPTSPPCPPGALYREARFSSTELTGTDRRGRSTRSTPSDRTVGCRPERPGDRRPVVAPRPAGVMFAVLEVVLVLAAHTGPASPRLVPAGRHLVSACSAWSDALLTRPWDGRGRGAVPAGRRRPRLGLASRRPAGGPPPVLTTRVARPPRVPADQVPPPAPRHPPSTLPEPLAPAAAGVLTGFPTTPRPR